MISMVYICITIAFFYSWRALQTRTDKLWLNPLLLSLLSIITCLVVLDIPYTRYMEGGRWLSYLVEPAVVVLGYPLYKQLKNLKKQWRLVMLSSVIASFVAMTSAVLLARLFGADDVLLRSIASMCITTAISMEVSEQLGGSPALAALLVMVAGVGGSVLGLSWLNILGIKDPIARGLAIGSASHALGTATISAESSVSGAYGSTALILSAVFTAIIAPYWVPFLLL